MDIQKRIKMALICQQRGDLEGAERHFKKCLELDSENFQILNAISAILLQRKNFLEAEKYLSRCLKIQKDYLPALYNLAMVKQSLGEFKAAKKIYERILKLDEGFVNAWNNLGLIYKEEGDYKKALSCFKRVCELSPSYAKAFNNLAVIYEELDELQRAKKALLKAIELDNDYYSAHFNLGVLLFRYGDFKGAKKELSWVLKRAPQEPTAKFLLNCMEQNLTDRAPKEYVKKTFDDWAHVFEKKLLKDLEYNTPRHLFDELKPFLRKDMDILDLGCGTGLGAELYRPFAIHLVGIDCSPKMLGIAKEKGLYDKLIEADILDEWENDLSFDLIYSSDCLCYFGDLSRVFEKVYKILKPNSIFGFSVEKLSDNSDFRLQRTGRFAHNKDYVREKLKEKGGSILSEKDLVLRKEAGNPVFGTIFVSRKIKI